MADVTPAQFFEELLPAGFAAHAAAGGPVPRELTLLYRLAGEGGGDWLLTIRDGRMTARRGDGLADVAVSLGIEDWCDAVEGRDGATVAVVIPQGRPGRPDNSDRVRLLRGTMALELARGERDPMRIEVTFGGVAAPRSVMKMTLGDYVAMQEGRLTGQEAFMTGRLRVEGDVAFLMQVAALTA
jgi:SCP-2 sterol transfer family protein